MCPAGEVGVLEDGEVLCGETESSGRSGAGLRQGVVGPGDRLCVGDPGRLSLDDRE